MPESNSARERLNAASEAKELSNFPSLKRAILRSRFVAILFTLALPVLALRAFEREFDTGILVTTAIDAVLVIGVWWFSVSLVISARERQWEKVNRMLGVGAQIALVVGGLSGLVALISVGSGQVAPGLIAALGAATFFVWRNDYVRARKDLSAMIAERGLESPPVDPAQSQIARRKLRLWMAAGGVLIAVLAGASWMAIESSRARKAETIEKNRARIHAEEEKMVADYEAEKAAKAERDQKSGSKNP